MEQPRKRVTMKTTSEAMRNWAAALAGEVGTWPGVAMRSAFGMTLVYRNGTVFAALPKTRALYEEDAILLKFKEQPASLAQRIAAEPRFAGTMEQRRKTKGKSGGEGQRWRIFRMRDDGDVHRAIEWLAEAYGVAGKASRKAR
jgi:hypothetical protein